MKLSKALLGVVLGASLIGGGVAIAQKPERDISARRHPNETLPQARPLR